MKKPFYKEEFRICRFFARLEFFQLVADIDDPVQGPLESKIYKILKKNKLDIGNIHNSGFIGPRIIPYHLRKWLQASLDISVDIFHCMLYNPIHRLPGFYDKYNANPRGIYQKWCRAFASKLSQEEIEVIERVAIAEGDDYYSWAVDTWKRMQAQKAWNWEIEILQALGIEKYFGYREHKD